MNNMRFFFRLVSLTVLIFFMGACSEASPPQASKTPTLQATFTPTPWGGASAKLGPVPQNCPPITAYKKVPGFGLAYGASPAWITFTGSSGHPSLVWDPTDATRYHYSYGWDHKFLWLVEATYKGRVSIHGASLRDGIPLRPEAESEAETSTPTLLVLDTQAPNIPNRTAQWTEFPGGLAIPEADCYYLEADWPGGSWRITFAAGEVPSYD